MDGLSGRFCFGHIKFAKKRIWVAFSLDHVRILSIIICIVELMCQSLIRQHKNPISLIWKRMTDTEAYSLQCSIPSRAVPNYINIIRIRTR
jgi:hypothetical protein